MRLKETVLTLLMEQRGSYLSGESIANSLGVSRNAVWKAVRQLQKDGHPIDAVHHPVFAVRGAYAGLPKERIHHHERVQTCGRKRHA